MRPILTLLTLIACLSAAPAAAGDEVADLLNTIQSSEASDNERANAFEKIGDIAGPAAVKPLAEFLDDEQWSHYARFALQKMEGEAVVEALLDALETLEGDLKLGVIGTLGRRRDEQAVSPLKDLLGATDDQVAAAAAVALGAIGTAEAADALTDALHAEDEPRRKESIASSILLVGQRLARSGNAADAIEVFDRLRAAEIPKAYRIGATQNAILARGADGVALLVEQLESSDRDAFHAGLAIARTLPGQQATQKLADVLRQETATDRTAFLIMALKDRGDPSGLPAILEQIESDSPAIQLAAIDALGALGNEASVPTLLSIVDQENEEAVLRALVDLRGDGVDRALLEAAQPPQTSLPAVEALGKRRVADAAPLLFELANSESSAVRQEAIVALGQTAPQERFLDLVALLRTAQNEQRKKAVQQAVRAAVSRSTHPDVCAAALGAMIPTSRGADRDFLFEQIRAAGGAKAVELMRDFATGDDDELQDIATKMLGTWLSADAGPVLLEVAEGDGPFANRALGGYIRIFRQFALPDEERVAMAAEAFRVATRANERNAAIEALPRFPCVGSFELALAQLDEAGSEETAATAVLTIGRTVRDLNPEKAKAGLKRLIDADVSPAVTAAAREMMQ